MKEVVTVGEVGDAGSLGEFLAALDHVHRLRIVDALTHGRQYVSALARELSLSRPLLYLHLERLEAAGIVTGSLELGADGKAVKYYALEPFDVHVTPELVSKAVRARAAAEEAPGPQGTSPTQSEE